METKGKPHPKHLGRKIGRIRELLGIKQETLADQLGISQQAISKIEQSENVEDSTLEKIGKVLGVSSEAIKNFNEESVISIIGNTITNNDQSSVVNFYPTFNPIDKWLEAIEENKKLNEENKKLYEALLKSERDKVMMLEKLLEGKR
jgi:transcriptional regulator with XRE-family HTH domain